MSGFPDKGVVKYVFAMAMPLRKLARTIASIHSSFGITDFDRI
ncbi:MAG: hypothetical protein VB876_01370 [Pirellulales bacterium]